MQTESVLAKFEILLVFDVFTKGTYFFNVDLQ